MKIPQKLFRGATSSKDKQGVALVTVLTVMALTTILVLTFFSLATSEHRASSTYSQGLQAQQVAEQAVNMVIAQIREATTIGTTNAWASQPGAIRNWDDTGTETFAYKLYSDDQMKVTDWADFQNDFIQMGAWDQMPNHYVDLNEPVIRGEKVYYPIVHPLASTVPNWPKPIGGDSNGVEGFSYNVTPQRSLPDGAFGTKAAGISQAQGHVAMPATWIYQLADGTLGVLAPGGVSDPDAESQFTPISGIGQPGENNRIVARFAFWADDETTKLNVNTHAGGLAWDVPRAGGELDMSMGRCQPAQKEWQRYPGHPATTHLIPALAPGVLDIVNDRDAMEMLFNIVPRVVPGGSESGTRLIDTRNDDPETGEANGLIPDVEPLFPSVDDLVMRSDRSQHQFPDAQGNPIQGTELSEYLERAKFFLTVTSRAPETNMFNQPRVAIWPIHNADYSNKTDYNKYLTAFDRLIHYCSSMGKAPGATGYPRNEYIFKRENEDSPTHDYVNILRNQEIYGYLADLMDRDIPGYGASLSSKYPDPGYRQILTEIFDYIRSTNLHDDSIFKEDFEKAYVRENTSDHATYTNPRSKTNKVVGMKGHGQVVPIQIPPPSGAATAPADTKGFGRFYSLGGVQVQVISCAEPGDGPIPANMGATSYGGSRDIAPSSIENWEGNPEDVVFKNFPPIPADFRPLQSLVNPRQQEVYLALEPEWLAELRLSSPSLYQAAFSENHWNWQLAYLDLAYYSGIMGDPNINRPGDPETLKFQRNALSPTQFQTYVANAVPYLPGSLRRNTNPFSAGATRLKGTEQLVQAALLFNLFTPSIGWSSINPDMEIEVERENGSSFIFSGHVPGELENGFLPIPAPVHFIGFENSPRDKWIFATNRTDTAWGGRRYGGTMPYEFLLSGDGRVNNRVSEALGIRPTPNNGHQFNKHGGRSRYTWLDRGYNLIPDALRNIKVAGDADEIAQSYRYDLITPPFKILGAVSAAGDNQGTGFSPGLVDFSGGRLTFRFYHGGEKSEESAPKGGANSLGVDGGELVQEIEVDVPDFNFQNGAGAERRPLMFDPAYRVDFIRDNGGRYNEFNTLAKDSFSFLERNNLGLDPGNPRVTNQSRISIGDSGDSPYAVGRFGQISVHARPSPFSITDIIQSVEIEHGDARLIAGKLSIPEGEGFKPHRNYYGESNPSTMAHSVTNAVGDDYSGAKIERDYLIIPDLPGPGGPYNGNRMPLPFGVLKSEEVQLYGDFDNGAGLMIDGPYINKPDEGNTNSLKTKFQREQTESWEERRDYGEFPYFSREWKHESGGPAYFSPNRLVSGPGMFGSLPTGLMENPPQPWRTILFRPSQSTGSQPGQLPHPGAGRDVNPSAVDPPDHMIMDLFWMPIVEPYAISEPLSTGGKVNINTEIMPYLHVNRDTAIRGVFRSEFMVCIPNQWHRDYKHNHGRGRGYHWRDRPTGGELQGKRLRTAILEDDTLQQFQDRFNLGRSMFKSATEITEIHLIPQEISVRLGYPGVGGIGTYVPSEDQMDDGSYWQDHALVGDNSREKPYTNIHNRITTKSNTFKVHYRAQVLKQSRRDDGAYDMWRPLFDSVQAEYRGSSIVERYVDPNLEAIPDFPNDRNRGLDEFYTYRVINPKRFAP